MTVTPITSLTQFKELIASDKPVVIDFWATWCGPCRMISPVLDGMSTQTEGIDFYKVDVDEQPEISQEVGIRAMPTFKVFKNGSQIGELVGANPAGLTSLVETHRNK